MKIYSGKYELFESGVAQTAFGNSIKFDFDTIAIEVFFKDDTDNTKKRSDFKVNDTGDGLILDLYNYNNSDASGFVEPVELGTLNDKALWFNFRAHRVTTGVQSWFISYFFYYGEPVNGQD